MVQSSNLTLSFSSESSIEEELKRESTADVITIIVSHLKVGIIMLVKWLGRIISVARACT
jgi:hypothetical protein